MFLEEQTIDDVLEKAYRIGLHTHYLNLVSSLLQNQFLGKPVEITKTNQKLFISYLKNNFIDEIANNSEDIFIGMKNSFIMHLYKDYFSHETVLHPNRTNHLLSSLAIHTMDYLEKWVMYNKLFTSD